MIYTFDSNIVLASLRSPEFGNHIRSKYPVTSPNTTFSISTVTVGELLAIAKKNHWGTKRQLQLSQALSQFLIIPINRVEILDQYAWLDAYSQGRLEEFPLPSETSARNMGKNDLWIAATASALGATLVTADKDFQHLTSLISIDLLDLSAFV
ncbi:MAG: PIN domain-containing protein [Bacteroidota bacterium]